MGNHFGALLAGSTPPGAVSDSSSQDIYVGGLVGAGERNATITGAYATGAVTVGTDGYAGGLMGYNAGSVTQAYAQGAVSGAAGAYIGGLVGLNGAAGAISQAYATGPVNGAANTAVNGSIGFTDVGGLAGENNGRDQSGLCDGRREWRARRHPRGPGRL